MIRHLIAIVLLPFAVALAAPVPKPTPTELIERACGTVADKRGCKLSMDGDKALTVALDAFDPPTEGTSKPNNGVSFRRELSGDFTVSVRYAIKTDLTKAVADNPSPRLHIGWYVRGAKASCWLDRAHPVHTPAVIGAVAKPVVGSTFESSLSIHNGDSHQITGRTSSGGGEDYRATVTEFRLTRDKDTLTLSYRDGDGKWLVGEKETVATGKDVTVALQLSSSFGGPVDVVLDRFAVK